MLKLHLDRERSKPLKILCLGAHSDDIEIGCGGTILQLQKNRNNIVFYWVVLSANEKRKQEARKSAETFLKHVEKKTIIIKNFKDGYFPYIGKELKDFFEVLKKSFSPDLIFTSCRHDLHQDHRLVSELTWNSYRDHMILEYEIAKYDGDLGSPNAFVHLEEAVCEQKIQNIISIFQTQQNNHWFSKEVFLSLSRLRGIESNAPDRYAEAYYCRKIILD
jgi:LmbE family N-acetylglucosaminyl deacetylase